VDEAADLDETLEPALDFFMVESTLEAGDFRVRVMCDSSDLREELDLGRPAARGDLCLDDRDLCCEEGDF
jgi:hypothetical protein